MQFVQITAKDISPALELKIRQRAKKLSRYCGRITSCRVVLESLQRHKHNGKLYTARIDVTVPGKEFVVTHKYDQDIYIAIREAFNAIERQLGEYSHMRKGHVKTHENVMHGHVKKLVSKEGYGFIEGVDGNEYYFSLTNMSHPQFAQLNIGDSVEYISQTQNEGRQAHHVIREKNHKIPA